MVIQRAQGGTLLFGVVAQLPVKPLGPVWGIWFPHDNLRMHKDIEDLM